MSARRADEIISTLVGAESARVVLELPSCPICGGPPLVSGSRPYRDRLHQLPGRFGLAQCAGCGLLATSPRPPASSIDAFYPPDYVSFATEERPSSLGLRGSLRAALRIPYRRRYGSDDATAGLRPGQALDLGCGSGVALAKLAGAGWDVWGLDPSPDAVAKARQRLRLGAERVVLGRAEDATFPAAAFDLVVMSHVLEHLHDPRAVLEKVRQWLVPGGMLIVRVPNVESLEARAFGRFWFGLDIPRHLFQFGPATAQRLVENAGLEVLWVRPQWQGSSLSGSVSHVVSALLRRRRPYRHSQLLYLALLPVAALLLGAGQGGALELMARLPGEERA